PVHRNALPDYHRGPGSRTATPVTSPVPTHTPRPTVTPISTRTSVPTATPGGPTNTPQPTPCTTFSDVPSTYWAYQYINYLVCHTVISGYADGTFRPGNLSTRGQIAKMVVLGEGWQIDTTNGPHFTDVPTSHAFYGYIETAYHHGAISGYA